MIKIVADTLSCISLDVARELGIQYLPQIIEFGDNESYRDDTEIDSATFLKKLRAASTLPHTAAPPPALYTPIYERLLSQGHTILVICPSSEVSGTVRSAEVAAKDFPGADIHIVDTRSIGSGLGVIVKKACEWAEEGLDVETITAKVLEMASREKILFLVDTLEYLQKGGRIGKAQALFGSLLQVKPILTLKDGHTEPVESQRTKRRAMARLCELVEQSCPTSSEAHITVMEGDAVEEANYLVGYFKKCLRVSEIPVFFLPPAILVHAGPGAVAVSFFTS